MGAAGSRSVYQVGLTKKETERLQRRFSRISRDGSQVDISDLAAVDELRSNPFVVRAFALFDSDCDGSLSLQDFTRAIDVLGHLNNTEQQLMFLFQMLDRDGSGALDAGKLVGGLRTVAGQSLGNDHLQEVAASLLAVHDKDGDEALNFEEFREMAEQIEQEKSR